MDSISRNIGAIGDGKSHPLSSVYSTLAQARAVYPFVSDLTQEVDWAATQRAIDVAFSQRLECLLSWSHRAANEILYTL